MSIQDTEDEDYNPDIYTLTDEDGNDEAFELLDILEHEGERYFALTPYYENPEDMLEDDADLVILKSELVNDEEMMVSIDDDDVYQEIGNLFIDRLSEMFEGIDYEEE